MTTAKEETNTFIIILKTASWEYTKYEWEESFYSFIIQ